MMMCCYLDKKYLYQDIRFQSYHTALTRLSSTPLSKPSRSQQSIWLHIRFSSFVAHCTCKGTLQQGYGLCCRKQFIMFDCLCLQRHNLTHLVFNRQLLCIVHSGKQYPSSFSFAASHSEAKLTRMVQPKENNCFTFSWNSHIRTFVPQMLYSANSTSQLDLPIILAYKKIVQNHITISQSPNRHLQIASFVKPRVQKNTINKKCYVLI